MYCIVFIIIIFVYFMIIYHKHFLLQVECHPYLTQTKLKNFCESNGVLLTGYAPLGSSKRPWFEPNETAILDDVVVKQIADKYKKTSPQVLIRFQVMIFLYYVLHYSVLTKNIVNLIILDPKECYSHTEIV